jgi:hypothetical protein
MLMTRFIATVEFQDGEYWISFPGIEKTYRLANQPEDIVLQARAFLDQQAKPVSVAGTMIDAVHALARRRPDARHPNRAVRRRPPRHLRMGSTLMSDEHLLPPITVRRLHIPCDRSRPC